MPNLSDLIGSGGKPKLITAYTSGTGTYTPTENNARCFVRLQGGGGGGWGTISTAAGGGGAMIELWLCIPTAGIAYAVGAGGAVSASGSRTTFGQFAAMPGRTAPSNVLPGVGGLINVSFGAVDADGVSLANGGLTGVSGGGGGLAATAGYRAGFPVDPASYTAISAGTLGALTNWQNTSGISSGGDSFFGKGGTDGNAPAAGNYGAGGGANAAGLGGYIEIWDFGA